MNVNYGPIMGLGARKWSERQDSNLRPLTPQISCSGFYRFVSTIIVRFCSQSFLIDSGQSWANLGRTNRNGYFAPLPTPVVVEDV